VFNLSFTLFENAEQFVISTYDKAETRTNGGILKANLSWTR